MSMGAGDWAKVEMRSTKDAPSEIAAQDGMVTGESIECGLVMVVQIGLEVAEALCQ